MRRLRPHMRIRAGGTHAGAVHARRCIRQPLTLLAILAVLALSLPPSTSAAEAEDNCASAPNPIVCENALPGEPRSDWQVEGVGDPTIQGYATSMSVNVGQTEYFKIDTPATAYHIDILRLGYYGGDGARLIASDIQPTAQLPQTQPECLHEASTGLIDCGNWGVSASWTVPSNAVSGVYIARLVRDDTGRQAARSSSSCATTPAIRKSCCRPPTRPGRPTTTMAATACTRARSTARPANPKPTRPPTRSPTTGRSTARFTTDDGASYLYYAEYQMMCWLEENGYNVSYTTESEVDRQRRAAEEPQGLHLQRPRRVLVRRAAGERGSGAREAGVNLAFFSGNEMFWKTRWATASKARTRPTGR